MIYRIYEKTNGVEQLVFDSENVSAELAISDVELKMELSKAGELEFVIYPTHPLYNVFHKMKTYVRVTQDDAEIFRGRVLEIENTIQMQRRISCEGDLAYLVDSFQPPQQIIGDDVLTVTRVTNSDASRAYGGHVSAEHMDITRLALGDAQNTSNPLAAQLARYILQHNSQMESEKQFAVGHVTIPNIGSVSFSSNIYRDTKTAIDNDLVEQYGGYMRTRRNPNGPTYIDWLDSPEEESVQPIVLGVNMVDLQQEDKGDNLFTIFVPIGEEGLTIASVNDGNIGIENTEGVAEFGRIYKTEVYNGITDANELKLLGQAYMAANYKPGKNTLNVKAIDLNLLDGTVDAIHVGSSVLVVSEPHDIELWMTCISIDYDIQNPENNNYEIGDAADYLSRKVKPKTTAAEAARSAGRANGYAESLEAAVNRHAANITDHADSVYRLEADLAQIHAKCVEIDATEKVTITTNDFFVQANGKVMISAGGYINLNDHVMIGHDIVDDYDVYAIGDAWFQNLTVGGWIHGAFMDEQEGIWEAGHITGMFSIHADDYLIGRDPYAPGGSTSLLTAVKSFGAGSADATGTVTIPYFTFSGGTTAAGNITFDMAGTAWYLARAVSSITATKEGITTQSGNTVSADFRLHAKNADGDDITSDVVNISLDFTGGSSSASNISLNDTIYWLSSSSGSPLPAGSVALNSTSSLIHDHRNDHGYIVFSAQLTNGSGTKWYHIPIGWT